MEFNISTTWKIVLVILVVWEWAWKGIALWKAGRNNQPGWFIALLLLNTVGILPIVYLLTHHTEEHVHEKTLPIN